MLLKAIIQKHPVRAYFVITFCISWAGAFLLVAGRLLNNQPIPKMTGLLMFILLLMGLRVLMVHVYERTKSIFILQFMHAISTGCLAMLGPAPILPAQEALWYFSYALLLWGAAILITRYFE